MTREEHLKFCKQCTNRQFDPQQGLVCSITGKIADFTDECKDFIHDGSAREEIVSAERSAREVITELPEDLKDKLRLHQNLLFAIGGGFFVTLICALLWAAITVSTEYQIGYMAIGLGLAVGLGVRFFGSGIDAVYGVIGALLALLGCAMGNLFSQLGFIAQAEALGYFETLTLVKPEAIPLIFQESFSPMDILFYGIATYEGYKFSFRPISSDIIQREDLTPEYAQLRLPLVMISVLILSVTAYSLSRGVNGPHAYYYASGAVMSEGEYVNGEMNGPWTYYDEEGRQQLLASYDQGKEEGEWKWYYESGLLQCTVQFVDDQKEGAQIFWSESGRQSKEELYKNNKLVSEKLL